MFGDRGGRVPSEGIGREKKSEDAQGQGPTKEAKRGHGVVLASRVDEQPRPDGSKERGSVEFVSFEIDRINAGEQQHPGKDQIEADNDDAAPEGHSQLPLAFPRQKRRCLLFLWSEQPREDKSDKNEPSHSEAERLRPCQRKAQHHASSRPRPGLECVLSPVHWNEEDRGGRGNPCIAAQSVNGQCKHEVQRYRDEAMVGPWLGIIRGWRWATVSYQKHR